nr:MAG TPA: hypothetical protein [Caudoviricetes sp.]
MRDCSPRCSRRFSLESGSISRKFFSFSYILIEDSSIDVDVERIIFYSEESQCVSNGILDVCKPAHLRMVGFVIDCYFESPPVAITECFDQYGFHFCSSFLNFRMVALAVCSGISGWRPTRSVTGPMVTFVWRLPSVTIMA